MLYYLRDVYSAKHVNRQVDASDTRYHVVIRRYQMQMLKYRAMNESLMYGINIFYII